MATPRLLTFATADATGKAVFTFPACPQGSVLTGVVAVTGAPPAAVSTANLGGVDYAPFLGANPFGPLQATSTETLKVTTTGLTSGTQYTAVWVVNEEPASSAQSGLIIPYGSSTVNAQGIAGGVPLAVSLTDACDRLYNATDTWPVNNGVASVRSFAAKNNYVGFVVTIFTPNASPPGAWCSVRSTSSAWSPYQSGFFNNGYLTFAFEMPAVVGDTVQFQFQSLGAAQVGLVSQVYGVLAFSQPSPLRPDGRLYPVGSKAIEGTTAAGQTLIAAPVVGYSILVSSISVYLLAAAGGPSGMKVTGTIGGTSVTLVAAAAPQNSTGASPSPGVPPGGILLDPATALVTTPLTNVPQAVAVDVVYDIVI